MLAVGDASGVPDACRPAAGIFSCFSLQQMPQPATVLARWAAALAPGGVLAVAYWCVLQGAAGDLPEAFLRFSRMQGLRRGQPYGRNVRYG